MTIYQCFINSFEIWNLFSQVPIRNCLWCLLQITVKLHLWPLKSVKKNATIIGLKYSGTPCTGFCQLKLPNLQVDSVLILKGWPFYFMLQEIFLKDAIWSYLVEVISCHLWSLLCLFFCKVWDTEKGDHHPPSHPPSPLPASWGNSSTKP